MSTATLNQPAQQSRKIIKVRLVGGDHATRNPHTGEPVNYVNGDVFEEFEDVVNSIDKPRQPHKFQRASYDDFVTKEEMAANAPPPVVKVKGQAPTEAELMKKPLPELVALATNEEIDLHGATKKEDVVRVIRAYYAS